MNKTFTLNLIVHFHNEQYLGNISFISIYCGLCIDDDADCDVLSQSSSLITSSYVGGLSIFVKNDAIEFDNDCRLLIRFKIISVSSICINVNTNIDANRLPIILQVKSQLGRRNNNFTHTCVSRCIAYPYAHSQTVLLQTRFEFRPVTAPLLLLRQSSSVSQIFLRHLPIFIPSFQSLSPNTSTCSDAIFNNSFVINCNDDTPLLFSAFDNENSGSSQNSNSGQH
ncbi:hypothetical protein DERF_013243 [Dermatophagoides farinae]|uniref:Uncharacterized protein n=1 Tax=Dermatophagoides farinae TaxID=6954 RepID=A0A922HP35_DERFA|nr:hypothetical protein DERF_013243 [Dermatophagoides farinae]